MFSLDENTNLCLSGGAEGADLQWGMCAGLLGHQVIHWSFADHHTRAPANEVVRLTDDQLAESTDFIKLAGVILKKHPPKQPFVKRLIQRNYFQVAWSDSVYAVATIKDGVVQGGTAWAVYMFLSRSDIQRPPVYVYDQARASWFIFNHDMQDWEAIESPPQPRGIWAGIGTRDLTPTGKQAIRDLMDFVKPQMP